MISPAAIVSIAASAALVILAVTFLVAGWRVIAGPTLPDRILALDTLSGTAIGFIAVIAVKTGFALYIDIAISLGLVGFLATVAFARFVMSRGVEPRPVGAMMPQAGKRNLSATKKPDATAKASARANNGRKARKSKK
jgi:multicomponent Na+:H+ antiporter subunit F